MAIIEREDGTQFISPSYREILSAKKKSLLKREVQMLSSNYGGYAYVRKKNSSQYEVALNNEGGYLLGESVLKYFDNTQDLIYCERLVDSKEAILVVIKGGSVYLDSKVSIDSIGEELIALRSQKNQYNIYLYGDVPISEKPSTTKFFFDEASVASFNELSESVFEDLPAYENIKLQPAQKALAAAGMGPIPIKPIVIGAIVIFVLYMGFNFVVEHKKSLPKVLVGVVDPYARFVAAMSTPNPADELNNYVNNITALYALPGASLTTSKLDLSNQKGFQGEVTAKGVDLSELYVWLRRRGFNMTVDSTGTEVAKINHLADREAPKNIFNLQSVLRIFLDRIKHTYANSFSIQLSPMTQYSSYKEIKIELGFKDITPNTLASVASTFKDLPVNFNSIETNLKGGLISGSLKITLMGN